MTLFKEYRRFLYEQAPDLVGRLEAVASLTTTTVVVTGLATGGYGGERFRGAWLLRAETASASDRVRKVTSFASATGTLTHAGANYSDTTATSEYVEILEPEYQPHIVDRELNTILGATRRMDRTIVPGVTGMAKYWLHDLSWVQEPNDVSRISVCASPVLTRNRYMEAWSGYNATTGALVPEWWTLSGADATLARSTVGARKGKYTVALTRAGTDAVFSQSVGLLPNGATDSTPNSLAGQTVTAVLVGTAASASQLRVTVDDGVTTTSSSYHTGGSGVEELTATHTLSATATKCDIKVEVNGTDGTAYVDEGYICWGQVTDAVRRDAFMERTVGDFRDVSFDQGGTLCAMLPPLSWGQQYVFWTQRAYPRLVDSRVLAGTADADTSDAPKELIAAGAMWRIHEALGSNADATTAGRYLGLAQTWHDRYEKLATAHLYLPEDHDGGVPLPTGTMLGGPRARRG